MTRLRTKSAALPRTLLGAGAGAALGAGAGAGAGALTAKDKNKRGKSALKGALIGGAAGVPLGFLAHGAYRTHRLRHVAPKVGKNTEEFINAIVKGARDGAIQGGNPSSAMDIGEKVDSSLRKAHVRLGQARTGFLGGKSVKKTIGGAQKTNPFQGLSTQDAAKKYKTLVRKQRLHPDSGSAEGIEKFKKLSDQKNRHDKLFKKGSVDLGLESAVWTSFFKEAMTNPALKSFKSGISSAAKAVKPAVPGKLTQNASTSGKGFTGILGRTATSAHPNPAPPRVTS